MPSPPESRRAPGLAIAVVGVVVAAGAALSVSALRMDRRWIEIHMTPHSCAELTSQLVPGTIVRGAALVVGVLLVASSPLVMRWARKRTPREVLGAFVRLVVAGALALGLSDLVLRTKWKPPPPIGLLHYEPDSEVDPRFTFRSLPSHTTEMRVGDKPIRFVIDSNGFRVRSNDDVVDFSRPTIAVVGESVASGFGLNAEETFSCQIAQRLGIQTVNMAVQGYSADWSYVRLSEELPRFAHPVATVTLLHHALIQRGIWDDRPHYLVDDENHETFVPLRVPDKGWVSRSPLLQLFADLYHSDEGLQRLRSIILATARASRAQGAFPLFVVTNCGVGCLPDETGNPSIDRILFDGLDVVYVHVDLPWQVYDMEIIHPNALAHTMIADAIEHALREHGVPTASR